MYTVHYHSLKLIQAPEEFLDPVTNELMKEPVRLPTSGVTMDKPNVIRHLLRLGRALGHNCHVFVSLSVLKPTQL